MSISPGPFAPETPAPHSKAYSTPEPSSGTGRKIPVLFGFVIALVAANVYLFYQLNQVRTDLTKKNDALSAELDKMKETSSITAQSSRRNVQA